MNKKLVIIIVSTVVAIGIVAGAILMTRPKGTKTIEQRPVTKAELASANGEDKKPCYVVVKGTVYEIKNSLYWQQGKHTTSEGQASCGRDLTDVITKSPHGETVLSSLNKIGPLQ